MLFRSIPGSSRNSPDVNLAANNLVSYNKAYNLNEDSFDSGNFYQYAAGRNNVYDHNMSYGSYAGFTNENYYLDYAAANTTVSNNIGYNPTVPPFDNSGNSSNTLTNNVASSNPAAWAAQGLDSSQMGLVRVKSPVWLEALIILQQQ